MSSECRVRRSVCERDHGFAASRQLPPAASSSPFAGSQPQPASAASRQPSACCISERNSRPFAATATAEMKSVVCVCVCVFVCVEDEPIANLGLVVQLVASPACFRARGFESASRDQFFLARLATATRDRDMNTSGTQASKKKSTSSRPSARARSLGPRPTRHEAPNSSAPREHHHHPRRLGRGGVPLRRTH